MDNASLHDAQRTVARLRYQLRRWREIYSEDLREKSDEKRTSAFAPDTDTVLDFIGYGNPSEAGRSFVEALMVSSTLRIPLLPGVIAELLDFCGSLAKAQPPVQTNTDLLAWLKHEHPKSAEREVLINLRQRLENATFKSDGLLKFLSAPNVVGVGDCGVPSTFRYGSDTLTNLISQGLRARRYPSDVGSSIRDRRDSVNIASVLEAAEAGIKIPLVTRTRVVVDVFASLAQVQRLTPDRLVMDPEAAFARIALQNAEKEKVLEVVAQADRLLELISSPTLNDLLLASSDQISPSDRVLQMGQECLEAMVELSNLGTALRQTWNAPVPDRTGSFDLENVLTLTLNLTKSLADSLTASTKRLNLLSGNLADEAKIKSHNASAIVWEALGASFEALRELGSAEPKIVIQKLIIIEKGATMSEYNINQTGSNLSAIVDSYKIAILGSSNNETQAYLERFVEHVMAGNLPNGKKQEIVEGATQVVEGVKKEKKLGGTLSLLWSGIHQAVVGIPEAVKAWEALKQLWS